MRFGELLEIVGDEPVFETGLLLAGDVDPNDVRRQLSRWTKAGRISQLRRGLYALAPPYQRVRPHPFLVANRLLPASYVSLQSALAFHGMIPEYVPRTTSVTTVRAGVWQTTLGDHIFKHIKTPLFFGYRLTELGGSQQALVAAPEKALLDLIYLQPEGESPAYLTELRLQNLERLNLAIFRDFAKRVGKPKLRRAATHLDRLAQAEREEYESL